MQLGMIGLGRMGGNIVRRLLQHGHSCVVYDKSAEAVQGLAGEGASGSGDLAAFVKQLEKPRAVWVMLPAGAITEATVVELGGLLDRGDIVIDGGNSFYQDDIRHAQMLAPKGICYVDVGTSGGVWGLERGYCMMIGGDADAVAHLDPIFKALAPGPGTIERTPTRQGRSPRRRSSNSAGCSPRATSSSTAATRSIRMTSAMRRCCGRRASAMSMSAPAAASGGWSAAIA